MPSGSRNGITSRLQKLSSLVCFALRSPAVFARASREGVAFVLDRELIHSSPLPILPNSIARKFYAVEVKLPPQGCLVDGTQSMEGLCFLVNLCKILCARSVFEIGTFTGVTALTLAVNIPQLVVDTLDLPVGRVPTLGLEKNDRTYMPLPSRQRVFADQPEAARIVQHRG